ncbi:hypothetical protein MPER_12643 [Moniliophthora perniciosa FA553]|nr:hypothetical protein MPER_12643 [Moniliophthora perniciosa FA553]
MVAQDPKSMRLEAIRQAILACEDAGDSNHALSAAEVEKQAAEQQLVEAEVKVEDCFERLSASAQRFSESMSYVRDSFSPERSLPDIGAALRPNPPDSVTKSFLVPSTMTSQHNSGAKHQEVAHTPGSPVPRTPGGIIRASAKLTSGGDVVEAGSNFPAYIVYVGPNNEHRFFTSWFAPSAPRKTIPEKNIEGLEEWVAGHAKSYFKGFRSSKRAREFFQECEDDGVFDVLKVEPKQPGNQLFYIVTCGVAPGVYTSKAQLVRNGLQFRGGTVTVYDGSLSEAKRMFNHWKGEGIVSVRERVIGEL